jgi:hypothetical protein
MTAPHLPMAAPTTAPPAPALRAPDHALLTTGVHGILPAGAALAGAASAAAQRALLAAAPMAINPQTGTAYTLLMADKGKLVTLSNADPVTVTVETTVATWLAGDRVEFLNLGAGAVTIAGDGVTINKAAAQTAVLAQGAAATLTFLSDTVAWLTGGMNAEQ